MVKKLIFIAFLIFEIAANSFAQSQSIVLPVSYQRTKSFPIDSTTVFTNYEDAVEYAAKGAERLSAAYKGQYIAVPTNGVYYIDNDWNLQEIGTDFTILAGNTFEGNEYDQLKTSELYFKMDYNTNHHYTTFTMMTNNVTGEVMPTLLIPQVGQRGSDGSNLKFGGYWDNSKSYSNETIVVWNGSAYYSIQDVPIEEPPIDISNTNYWKLFVEKGEDGETGTSATIQIGSVKTTNWLSPASVTNSGTETDAIFDFVIPRGDTGEKGEPGLGLIYGGQWTRNSTYPSNTVVRYGSNLWWTAESITNGPEPDTDSRWDIYLKDGKDGEHGKSSTVTVDPQVIPVTYGNPAYVNVETNSENNVYLQFGIPGGAPGTPGLTMKPHVDRIYMLDPSASPSTSERTSGTDVYWTFNIPRGLKGDPGANIVFKGEWEDDTPYASNSLVTRFTNSWYTLEDLEAGESGPGVNPAWKIFVASGEKGDTGNTIVPFAYASNVPYGTPASVSNNLKGLTNYFYFGIPEGKQGERGFPGLDLVYAGTYDTNSTYQANSFVRYETNLWYTYTDVLKNKVPGESGSPWELLLSDGKAALVTVDPIVESLEPGTMPYVHSTPIEGGNEVELKFGIPKGIKGDDGDKGDKGDPGNPGVGLNYRGLYDEHASQPYSENSLVRYGTNLWWNSVSTSEKPGTSSDWEIFLDDGRNAIMHVDPEVERLDYTNNPYITVDPPEGGQEVTLQFHIPEGAEGPIGPKGDPGVGLNYRGLFDTNEVILYNSNSLVRFGTNLWWNEDETSSTPGTSEDWKIFISDGRPAHITVNTNVTKLDPSKKPYITTNPVPGNEQDIEIQFHIPQGYKGDTGTISVGDVRTGDPGTDVIINNSGTSTDARFNFTIPRGYPGAGLTYVGDYEFGHQYLENSLVKVNTDLWYANTDTTDTPSTNSIDWSSFLTTTKFNILTNGESLNPTQNPEVISSYDETNNIVTMQFKIPRGVQGVTKSPIPGTVSNVPPVIVGGVEKLGKATVSLSPIQPDPNNLTFDFGIPAGLTGSQGPIGPSGKNATIIIGSVTNVEPISTNQFGPANISVITNESENSYTFNFGIPAGLKGQDGKKGDKGDNGATLVPKGTWSSTNTYFTNELVRFESAQYYVIDDNGGQGISGTNPTNDLSHWSVFLQDGSGTAVDATTLFSINEQSQETWYKGPVLLDTNTLVVVSTNINNRTYDTLTVVGGPGGGGGGQWEIDMQGDIMPAQDIAYGKWEYDVNEDLMPPL